MNRGIAIATLVFNALAFPTIATSLSAQPATAAPAAPASQPDAPPTTKKAYANLFQAPIGAKSSSQLLAAQATAAAAGRPEVRCGIVVIPADPQIDPKIRVGPNTPPTTKHTMRLIEPPCPAATGR